MKGDEVDGAKVPSQIREETRFLSWVQVVSRLDMRADIGSSAFWRTKTQ